MYPSLLQIEVAQLMKTLREIILCEGICRLHHHLRSATPLDWVAIMKFKTTEKLILSSDFLRELPAILWYVKCQVSEVCSAKCISGDGNFATIKFNCGVLNSVMILRAYMATK